MINGWQKISWCLALLIAILLVSNKKLRKKNKNVKQKSYLSHRRFIRYGETLSTRSYQSRSQVYAVARSVDKMKDLEAMGGHIMKMDVTSEEDIEKVVAQVIAEQGRIDVLWNNAGYGLYGPVEDLSMEKVQQQMEVNVYGVARLTKKVLPYMRAQKEGLIINTSSMGGKIYTPLGAWYHASKHAIEGFSDCLRMEVKEFGIKVVILEPGVINTGFNAGVSQNFSYESKNGAYKRLVNGYIKAMENNPTPDSNPEVISRTVLKIINARNPKTCYLVGRGGKLLVGIRRVFGDKFFDRMMLMSMR